MNEPFENRPGKKRWFPSVAAIFAGLIPGVVALFNEFSSPFWIALNIVLVVLALGFAAANVIGLVVVKYRSSSKPDAHDR